MEEHKAKKEVWTMTDKWKSTMVAKFHSYLNCNKNKVHLACPVGMAEVLEASFY